VISSLDSGGAQKMLVDLIRNNDDSNNTMDVFVLNNNNTEYYRQLTKLGVNIYINKNNKYWSLENIRIIRNLSMKYDIVHSHLFHAQYQVSLSKLFFKFDTPICTTEHSTYNRRRKKPFEIIEKIIYSQYSACIAISFGVKKALSTWLGSDTTRIKTIMNGVILKDYGNLVQLNVEADLKTKDKVILTMIGRFVASKNQKMIIDALDRLPKKYFLILAGDGDNLDYIKKYTNEKGLSHRVKFTGYANNVSEILEGTDIYIQASNWEGFGLAALEAMAAGKPVIATNVEGLRDLIGKVGILVENDDFIELSEKIIELETNPKLLNKVVQSCVEKAKEYDIKNTIKDYIDLYKALIN
jgi:glycosyltransferase involved in cell wall biosynthesis